MHWIETIRKRYGLTQDDLALYLSVSRSTIALSENNQRELPTQAMLLLAPLLQPSDKPMQGDVAIQWQQQLAADADKAKQLTEKAKQKAAIQLAKAQRQLVEMQQKLDQAEQCIQLVSKLQQLPIPTDTNLAQRQKIFMDHLVVLANLHLHQNGLAAQYALQQTITKLQSLVKVG